MPKSIKNLHSVGNGGHGFYFAEGVFEKIDTIEACTSMLNRKDGFHLQGAGKNQLLNKESAKNTSGFLQTLKKKVAENIANLFVGGVIALLGLILNLFF